MTENESAEIVKAQPQTPSNLFATDDPNAVIERASGHAKVLADVVRDQNLTSNIQGKEHVNVEGWTLLGSMLGVFPVTTWSRQVHEGDNPVGWEARVEAQTMDGRVVGAAEAQCTRAEGTWRNRDDFALRSMAQTRAVSKALRMPLGFVMQLAGFDPSPSEEMTSSPPQQQAPPQQPQGGGGEELASEPQQRKIRATCNDDPQVSDEALHWAIQQKYGVESTQSLTKKQASELIEKLSDSSTRQKIIDGREKASAQSNESNEDDEDDEIVEGEVVDETPPEDQPL